MTCEYLDRLRELFDAERSLEGFLQENERQRREIDRLIAERKLMREEMDRLRRKADERK